MSNHINTNNHLCETDGTGACPSEFRMNLRPMVTYDDYGRELFIKCPLHSAFDSETTLYFSKKLIKC